MHKTKNETQAGVDASAIQAATKNLEDGAVTAGYLANRKEVVTMLNTALATELVCVLRYKRHYYTVDGLKNGTLKAEFLQHAKEEQQHADLLADRIGQLNGKPDLNPATLLERSHAMYDDSESAEAMVKSNLIAERVAIENYRQMIEAIGSTDITTKHMLIAILATEEKHAEDMRNYLG